MCGIAGIISGTGPVNPDDLRKMNACVRHRGPDGEGLYIKENVGFGHRRLSIIDLSERAAQPMSYGTDLTITYNGEIYNYIEIREELVRKGYTFESDSDTEVILAAYQEYGTECTHRFNGMWAFAIHDLKNKSVFLSRDRFGVKPLYYCEVSGTFVFGSEIRQLLTRLPSRRVNRQILFDYVFLGYHHHTSDTFFDGIKTLDAGHNLVFDLTRGEYEIKQWYKLNSRDDLKGLSFADTQALFKRTIDDAIKLRLRSDVKVGTCLSGGLDSSYISAVAAEEYSRRSGEKFMAITAKSIERQNDESGYAEMVVNASLLDWRICHPQKADFLRVIDDIVEAQEEPFGSPSIIMQYFVMEKAKTEGCVVLLDGQGADEALLGYDRYFPSYISTRKGIFRKVKAFCDVAANSNLGLLNVFLYYLYFKNHHIRAARQFKRFKFIKPEFRKYLNKALLKTLASAGKNITELQKLEITRVQLQKLLRYEDKNSMRFSIETRVPFVDYRVIELALSLPVDFKIKHGWSKYVLRKSAETILPAEIVWRKRKIGFEAPRKWFDDRGEILRVIRSSEFLRGFLDTTAIPDAVDDSTFWRLFNLAVWARKFEVTF